MSYKQEYWQETLSELFDHYGIKVTASVLEKISADVAQSHDCYGESTGELSIQNPLSEENSQLKKQLKREKDKMICEQCSGTGGEWIDGPYHSSYSDCYKCDGTGFIYRA